MFNRQNFDELIDTKRYDEAMRCVSEAIEEKPDDTLYLLRGRLHWKLGDRPGAMSDYCRAVDLNAGSPAAMLLEQARGIADFFNPDLLNP